MLKPLNQLPLPLKYAVLLMAASSLATPILYFFGLYSSADNAVIAPLAGGIGGYVGGMIRESLGRKS